MERDAFVWKHYTKSKFLKWLIFYIYLSNLIFFIIFFIWVVTYGLKLPQVSSSICKFFVMAIELRDLRGLRFGCTLFAHPVLTPTVSKYSPSKTRNAPIKFHIKTVWLSGHNPLARLCFVVSWSLFLHPAKRQAVRQEVAAPAEGGLISLIDLHCRGCALRA